LHFKSSATPSYLAKEATEDKMPSNRNQKKALKKVTAAVTKPVLAEPTMDAITWYQNWCLTDPIQVALSNGTMSWADTLDPEPLPTPEEAAAFSAAQAAYAATVAERRAGAAEEERLQAIQDAEESAKAVKDQYAEWASQDYWRANHCTCYKDMTYEEFEALSMGELRAMDEGECACYKKVHLDENGEPEECRFFNSPAGCRDGADCFYKHIERDPSQMPCRFEASAVGCNPGFGRKCPYMHSKPQVAAPPPSDVLCRFDGRCHPPAGSVCPYKHSDAGWRSAPAPSWRSGGGSAAGGGSSAETMCRFDGRCNPAPGKKCPFKHSKPSCGHRH